MSTNKEALQKNNAKIKEITETLKNKILSASEGLTQVTPQLILGNWETEEAYDGEIEKLEITEGNTDTSVYIRYSYKGHSTYASYTIDGFSLKGGYANIVYDPYLGAIKLTRDDIERTFYKRLKTRPTIELVTGVYEADLGESYLKIFFNSDGTFRYNVDGMEISGNYIIDGYIVRIIVSMDGQEDSIDMEYDGDTGNLWMSGILLQKVTRDTIWTKLEDGSYRLEITKAGG